MPTTRRLPLPEQAQHTIGSSYSRVIARELGLNERELPLLLEGTGLPSSILLPEDRSPVSVAQQLLILDNVRRLAGDGRAGLLVGRALQPASHGPLGFLAMSSPSVGAALEALRDFLPTRIPFVGVSLKERGGLLRCGQHIYVRVSPAQRRLLQESFSVVVQSLLEAVVGGPLRGIRFEFAHPAPVEAHHYREFLHGQCRFDAASTGVLLPLAEARRRNMRGDTAAYALARETCERLLAAVPEPVLSTTARVRRLLLTLPAGSLDEEQAARYLFVSRRTLCCRLEEEGSSFRSIRERVWADLALQHLADPRLSVDSVAAMLGYADSAAFRKACRRWYGKSPSALRAEAALP